MNLVELKQKLVELEDMQIAHILTPEKAEEWRLRYIQKFENDNVPEKTLPNDVAHLPGRMIAGLVDVGKAIARGSGATYEHLEKLEEDRNARQRGKSVVDLYNDLQ